VDGVTFALRLALAVFTMVALGLAAYLWSKSAGPGDEISRAPAPRSLGSTTGRDGDVFTEEQGGRRVLAAIAVLFAVVLFVVFVVVLDAEPIARGLALVWVAALLLGAGALLWTGRLNRLTVTPEGVRLRGYDGTMWVPAQAITRIDVLHASRPTRSGTPGSPSMHFLLVKLADTAEVGPSSRRQRKLLALLHRYRAAGKPAVIITPDDYPGGVDAVCAAVRRHLPRARLYYGDSDPSA
jgi:hypothetical protein